MKKNPKRLRCKGHYVYATEITRVYYHPEACGQYALLSEGYLVMAEDSKRINREWEEVDVDPPEY
jgi:hypothetical protein